VGGSRILKNWLFGVRNRLAQFRLRLLAVRLFRPALGELNSLKSLETVSRMNDTSAVKYSRIDGRYFSPDFLSPFAGPAHRIATMHRPCTTFLSAEGFISAFSLHSSGVLVIRFEQERPVMPETPLQAPSTHLLSRSKSDITRSLPISVRLGEQVTLLVGSD
jgi:hypothetical protein